jgi:hypothetical protein
VEVNLGQRWDVPSSGVVKAGFCSRGDIHKKKAAVTLLETRYNSPIGAT